MPLWLYQHDMMIPSIIYSFHGHCPSLCLYVDLRPDLCLKVRSVVVKATLPGALHSEGAGAVHGEVPPPGNEEAGTAEGGVAHDDGLGGEGDAGPGAEVDRGHQAGEASHQVNNSTASIVHGAQLVEPTIGGPVMSAITVREH